jgi:putative flippase GtrA
MFTHSSFIKFIIVGGMGFILDFSIAYILIHRMDFAKPTANALSAEMAIISNFLFNNFWSFAHKRIDGGLSAFIKKLLTFNVVSSGSIFIQWLGMTLALNVFGDKVLGVPSTEIHFHSWILYKVLIIIFLIIPYSYIIYNKVIWRTRKRDV